MQICTQEKLNRRIERHLIDPITEALYFGVQRKRTDSAQRADYWDYLGNVLQLKQISRDVTVRALGAAFNPFVPQPGLDAYLASCESF
jgi:hypothetical protein